jgi:hypothetical protein
LGLDPVHHCGLVTEISPPPPGVPLRPHTNPPLPAGKDWRGNRVTEFEEEKAPNVNKYTFKFIILKSVYKICSTRPHCSYISWAQEHFKEVSRVNSMD